MEDTPVYRTPPTVSHALLPDAIIGSIVLTHPKERVLVKGRISELRPWPKEAPQAIYGTLKGEQSSIDFKCPLNRSPRLVGEYTVLSGFLSVQPKRHDSGVDILLTGEPVESWTPPLNSAPFIPLLRQSGRKTLRVAVREHGVEALLVLTTGVGQSDFQTALTQQGTTIGNYPIVQAHFGDRQKLLADLDHALAQHPAQALAFVRGGGGATGLTLWDDPELVCALLARGLPFYTAVGHSDRLLLADKYSDESFATPTAFGQALGQAVHAVAQERRQASEIEALQQETVRLTQETERLTSERRRLTTRHWQHLLWTWGMVGVLAAILVWRLWHKA